MIALGAPGNSADLVELEGAAIGERDQAGGVRRHHEAALMLAGLTGAEFYGETVTSHSGTVKMNGAIPALAVEDIVARVPRKKYSIVSSSSVNDIITHSAFKLFIAACAPDVLAEGRERCSCVMVSRRCHCILPG